MSSWRRIGSSSPPCRDRTSRAGNRSSSPPCQERTSRAGSRTRGLTNPWTTGPATASSGTIRASTGRRRPSSRRSWSTRCAGPGGRTLASRVRTRRRAARTRCADVSTRTPAPQARKSTTVGEAAGFAPCVDAALSPDPACEAASGLATADASRSPLVSEASFGGAPVDRGSTRDAGTAPNGDERPTGIVNRRRTSSQMACRTLGDGVRDTRSAAAAMAASTVNWMLTPSMAASQCRARSSIMAPPPSPSPVAAGRTRSPPDSGRHVPRGAGRGGPRTARGRRRRMS